MLAIFGAVERTKLQLFICSNLWYVQNLVSYALKKWISNCTGILFFIPYGFLFWLNSFFHHFFAHPFFFCSCSIFSFPPLLFRFSCFVVMPSSGHLLISVPYDHNPKRWLDGNVQGGEVWWKVKPAFSKTRDEVVHTQLLDMAAIKRRFTLTKGKASISSILSAVLARTTAKIWQSPYVGWGLSQPQNDMCSLPPW